MEAMSEARQQSPMATLMETGQRLERARIRLMERCEELLRGEVAVEPADIEPRYPHSDYANDLLAVNDQMLSAIRTMDRIISDLDI